jgi:hypothetical protein
MSQGALLQLLLKGDQDAYIHSEDFLATKPFRQVYKKVTPYSVATLDMNVALPTNVTYGQTLRFFIPRKGDLLTSMTIRMRVKKTSETGYYPAEEAIESISLVMGKQVIEEFTGEYIRIHHTLMDTPDHRDARYRMSDFNVDDTQGTEKLLYCSVPFYFSYPGCCLPLIALQYTQPEVVVKFKSSVTSFDPTYQPQIQITGEYVFLDDTEREWWTRQDHDMLFPYLQTVEDRVDIEQTKLGRLYTTLASQFGVPDSITGAAAAVPEDTVITVRGEGETSYITVVDPSTYPGTSTITYGAGSNASAFTIQASLLLPKDPNNGGVTSVFWARTLANQGYRLDFRFDQTRPNHAMISMYRAGEKIMDLSTDTVFTSALTAVQADNSSFDVRSQQFIDDYGLFNLLTTTDPEYEVWINVDINHNLEGISTMTMTYEFDIYEIGSSGGKLDNQPPLPPPLSTQQKYLQVTEGYSAINTIDIPSSMGFTATSTLFPCHVADITLSTRQVEIAPVDDNLTVKKTKIYNPGPIRYMAWVTTPLNSEDQWGNFSTGETGTYTTRYDPLDSAQILINGKPRTEMEDATYFSVYHPLMVAHKSLPAGVHMYSFSNDIRSFHPDASMNFSRAGDVTLYSRYKKWNPTATSTSELLDSESLPGARDYKRIRIYLVGYNVLTIRDGTMALMQV